MWVKLPTAALKRENRVIVIWQRFFDMTRKKHNKVNDLKRDEDRMNNSGCGRTILF